MRCCTTNTDLCHYHATLYSIIFYIHVGTWCWWWWKWLWLNSVSFIYTYYIAFNSSVYQTLANFRVRPWSLWASLPFCGAREPLHNPSKLPPSWWLLTTSLRRCVGDKYTGVSINGGTPKWMVYKGKSHQNGWFRNLGEPPFQETSIYMFIIIAWLDKAQYFSMTYHELPKKMTARGRGCAQITKLSDWWMMMRFNQRYEIWL